FTGAPVSVYMQEEEILSRIAELDGIEAVTTQFYGKTLNAGCCSSLNPVRLIGYDSSTDWTLEPWMQTALTDDLPENAVILGCKVYGFSDGAGKILGHDVTVASVLEETATSLDYSIFMSMGTVRSLLKEQSDYDHYWEDYGAPEAVISAVLLSVTDGKKDAVANQIAMNSNYYVVQTGNVLQDLNGRMESIFHILTCISIFFALFAALQLFARFFTMTWDRKNEFGLYRALGASIGTLRKLIAGEAGFLWLCGIVTGLPLGAVISDALMSQLQQQSAFPSVFPETSYLILTALISVLIFGILIALAIIVPICQSRYIDPYIAMQSVDID
ncbi:MAG: ABC transporter permease, partial [Ruminococcus sp.]